LIPRHVKILLKIERKSQEKYYNYLEESVSIFVSHPTPLECSSDEV
jgi:hypothetical protein